MGRIVISDDKSLENLDIRFDHLLLGQSELDKEKENFKIGRASCMEIVYI